MRNNECSEEGEKSVQHFSVDSKWSLRPKILDNRHKKQ